MRKATIILVALALGTCSRPPTTLEEVLQSGQLRVLTRNSPTTFYSGARGLDGLEFQLVTGFANYLSDKYDREIEPSFMAIERFNDLIPSLERGRAHIAAAGLTVTDERRERVSFGPVYQTVQQHLIYRLNTGKPRSLTDLRDKEVQIMAGTSYVDTLHELRYLEPQLNWSEHPEAEISELLVAVNNQEIDYTVADSTDFAVHRYYMPDLRIALDLTNEDELAWAFRLYRNKELQAEANEYFKTIRSTGELEQVIDRYYGHTNRFDYVGTRTFIRDYRKKFNHYRPLFEQAARQTGVDWRLLAAIGYQESHWNPEAVSPTGVRGLMMLTQVTANTMGVTDREDPDEAIPGGAAYLKRLQKLLKGIAEPDRTWFALAAYNVGLGHVQDARLLTSRDGGDPDRWVDVKEKLPLLAIRRWYSTVPHGYARGWEPVRYVDNVRTYYEILNWLTLNEQEAPQAPVDAQQQSDSLQTANKRDFLGSWL